VSLVVQVNYNTLQLILTKKSILEKIMYNTYVFNVTNSGHIFFLHFIRFVLSMKVLRRDKLIILKHIKILEYYSLGFSTYY